MSLKTKKKLIARTLKVGVDRVIIDESMKDEIKEAITRQDVKELKKSGAIKIKELRGRKRAKKRKRRTIKKKLKSRKQDYVKIVRKLRSYIKNLKGKITKEKYKDLRKKIKARVFKNISHLKKALK